MGADRPKIEKPQNKASKPFPLLIIGAAMLLVAIALFPKTSLPWDNGATVLSPQEEAKLQKRLKEIDDSEQYALLATEDGWYPCLHSGRKSFYLRAGEVWKYGITSKGKLGRYTPSFMLKNKVSYIAQFNGNFAECLKQEQIKLYNYPYLPENLSRPASERLPRPPYNPVMR